MQVPSGNRGVKNRGNLYENTFANAVRGLWDEQKTTADVGLNDAVAELAKLHDFENLKTSNSKRRRCSEY